MNMFLTRKELFLTKFLLFPWCCSIFLIFFEIFLYDNFFISFYLLSLYFIFNRIYSLILYISMIKACRLESFTFDKFFPTIIDFFERTFYLKNILFINSLILNKNLISNENIVKYLWLANKQITFFYEKESLFFILKVSLLPKINKFISNVNFLCFLICFMWLSSFSFQHKVLIIALCFLSIFYLAVLFLSIQDPKQQIFYDMIVFHKIWSEKMKKHFLKRDIKLNNFKFKHFSFHEFLLFEKLSESLSQKVSLETTTKDLSKIQELENKIDDLIILLGQSPLTPTEFALTMEEVVNFQNWFKNQVKLGKIHPITFDFEDK